MSSPVEQIKERIGIVDVVGSYLKLEKAGTYLKARCPFHNEKSASFFVSPARGTYHCFGCAQGGDIFTFVEAIEGVDFREALRILAERAGVVIEKSDPQARSEQKELYTVLKDATDFFVSELTKNKDVQKYLHARALTDETLRTFQIGYAPNEWRQLSQYLERKGHTIAIIEKAGLSVTSTHGPIDRFRGRIMFPIMDTQGRIVAFTGRIFIETDTEQAKYVNSPETVLYNKSNILYGFHTAKQAILRLGYVIIVEGQVDFLMSYQAGFENTVAVSGTAFTASHVTALKRFTEKALFAFDGDDAGVKAGVRALELALLGDLEVKLIALPKGEDPASCIQKEGVAFWTNLIENAEPIIQFMLKKILDQEVDERAQTKAIETKVLPYVAKISSELERARMITKIAHALGVRDEDIRASVAHIVSARIPETQLEKKSIKTNLERLQEQLLGLYFLAVHKQDTRVNLGKIEDEWMRIFTTPLADMVATVLPATQEKLLYQADMFYTGKETLDKEVTTMWYELEKVQLEERLQYLLAELKRAEAKHDTVKALDVLGECQKISKRIDEIKNYL